MKLTLEFLKRRESLFEKMGDMSAGVIGRWVICRTVSLFVIGTYVWFIDSYW